MQFLVFTTIIHSTLFLVVNIFCILMNIKFSIKHFIYGECAFVPYHGMLNNSINVQAFKIAIKQNFLKFKMQNCCLSILC